MPDIHSLSSLAREPGLTSKLHVSSPCAWCGRMAKFWPMRQRQRWRSSSRKLLRREGAWLLILLHSCQLDQGCGGGHSVALQDQEVVLQGWQNSRVGKRTQGPGEMGGHPPPLSGHVRSKYAGAEAPSRHQQKPELTWHTAGPDEATPAGTFMSSIPRMVSWDRQRGTEVLPASWGVRAMRAGLGLPRSGWREAPLAAYAHFSGFPVPASH